MRRILPVVLACLMALSALPAASAQEGGLTVDASWCVLVPEDATPREAFAAGKLSRELSYCLGAEIPVVTKADARFIAVGSASRADVSGVADNGYRIAAIDGNIHIGGTGARGLAAAAYRFLEEFCGRKVYTAELIVFPRAAGIRVPADADIVYEPYFEYTDTDWRSPWDAEYSLANGLNGDPHRTIDPQAGGTVRYIGGFCHTMADLCESEAHALTDPEQLALHGGERTTAQPCLTNPDVLAIAIRNVLADLERWHDPDASLEIVSVTQNDNTDYCECERCRAFEAAHGGAHSATMLDFVNRIADAVLEAGYTNVAVDTFAYTYTREAPSGIVPRDNVIIRFCTIEGCFRHALDDPGCERNAPLMKDLRDWSAICRRIYIWDYTTNYADTCSVFPDFGVIRRNIRTFYEHNVRGVYEEGNYYIDRCDTEFGELRAYMIAKCLQDPYCDLEREIDGFLRAYYGPGWEAVRKIISMYASHPGERSGGHLWIYDDAAASLGFTDGEIAEIDALWRAAREAGGKEYEARIARSELSWRYWKSCTRRGEFSPADPRRFDESERLFRDLTASGVRTLDEWSDGDCLDCLCVRYVPADEWNWYEPDDPASWVRLAGFALEEYAMSAAEGRDLP